MDTLAKCRLMSLPYLSMVCPHYYTFVHNVKRIAFYGAFVDICQACCWCAAKHDCAKLKISHKLKSIYAQKYQIAKYDLPSGIERERENLDLCAFELMNEGFRCKALPSNEA